MRSPRPRGVPARRSCAGRRCSPATSARSRWSRSPRVRRARRGRARGAAARCSRCSRSASAMSARRLRRRRSGVGGVEARRRAHPGAPRRRRRARSTRATSTTSPTGCPDVVDGVRAFPARAVVLDGEAIGVDDDERPHAFQDTMSSFGATDSVDGAAVPLTPSSSTCCTSTVTISSIDRSASGSSARTRIVGERRVPSLRDRRSVDEATRSSTTRSPPATRA